MIPSIHFNFFIFGLSGAGKTTVVENVCRDKTFFLAPQTVTRAPRADDNPEKYEYVTQKVFKAIRDAGDFFLHTDGDGDGYGYRWSVMDSSRSVILYGLPWKLDILKGGFAILIEGNAQKGLEVRGDCLALQEKRKVINHSLQTDYYGKSEFRERMDLILNNEFGKLERVVALFHRFVLLKKAEICALNREPKSLLFVLETYRHPLEGMAYCQQRHRFWVRLAFTSRNLSSLFYSNVLQQRIPNVKPLYI